MKCYALKKKKRNFYLQNMGHFTSLSTILQRCFAYQSKLTYNCNSFLISFNTDFKLIQIYTASKCLWVYKLNIRGYVKEIKKEDK